MASFYSTARSSGLPDVIDAYHQAKSCQGNPLQFSWTHPLVYQAACLTGFSQLRLAPPQESFLSFKDHYQQLKNKLLQRVESQAEQPLKVIQSLSQKLGIDPGLLYYLTKPEGSEMRARLRACAIDQLMAQEKTCCLPA